MSKPTPTLMRAITDETVLRLLMAGVPLTRAEISSATGLSKPTAGESVRRLEALGLVADTGEVTRGRGGVGTYYALAPDAGVALAVGLAPEGVVAEVLGADGVVLGRAVRAVERPVSRDAVEKLLVAAVEEVLTGPAASSRVSPGTDTGAPEVVTRAVPTVSRPDPEAPGVGMPVTQAPPADPRPATGIARPVAQAPAADVRRAGASGAGPVRATVVSAADPVDRTTGRLVHLPDSPFLLGALAPAEHLEPLVGGTVLVDNDVNWAARAERDARAGRTADFVYLYLGEGLGGAVVADGEVRRGHGGLAGEISHVTTIGGESLIEVFAGLGLRQHGSTAIDVERLLEAAEDPAVSQVLGRAVAGVVKGAVAFLDPELVVLGGSWGSAPVIVAAVQAEVAALPRPVPVEPALLTEEPALAGARSAAHALLQDDIVRRSSPSAPDRP